MSGLMRLEEKRGTDENKSRGVKTEDMTEIIRSSVDPNAETKATRRKNSVIKRYCSFVYISYALTNVLIFVLEKKKKRKRSGRSA